jgi:hypothetical protein
MTGPKRDEDGVPMRSLTTLTRIAVDQILAYA